MEITIIISTPYTKKEVERITVKSNMTIKEVKEIYYKKDSSRTNNQWTYNAEVLKDNRIISDYDIKNLDIIVAHPSPKGGGPGINTIDVSKNNTKILEFDPSAPSYRTVQDGLNIQAECSNERCEAYNKIVYCRIGFVNNYDILANLEKGNIKCPACYNEVYPKNYGFLRCKYKIDFTKWENNKKTSNTVNGEVKSEFKVFSENSGNANFTKLIFNVSEI